MRTVRPPLFVYGTLRDADVRAAVLGGRAHHTEPGRAPGYRAARFPGRAYPALVRASEWSAPGLLLEGLRPADLAALDAFEGTEYRRRPIRIATQEGTLTALAYLPAILIPRAAPSWDFAIWQRRDKPRELTRERNLAARNARRRAR